MEYTIKEVTKKYNLSASTLRYYEKEGLLPKIKKNQSNQRVYDDDDLSWLDIIMCMRKTGMTIAYIKNYIELCQEGDNTINQRYEIFLKQKEILLLQQQELEKNIETVNYKINLYKEKLLKPEKEIYMRLLEEYNLKSEETIFIDDTLANVQGAEVVGINTIHFKDSQELMAKLNELLIL